MPLNPTRQRSRCALGPEVAVIAVGGGIGSLIRYSIATAWPPGPNAIPWSTLTINVSGSLLLGLLVVAVVELWPHRRLIRPFLGTGVLGGFTTFSTFAVEVRGRPAPVAWTYLGLSLILGLTAAAIGMALMHKLIHDRRMVAGADIIDPLDPDQP